MGRHGAASLSNHLCFFLTAGELVASPTWGSVKMGYFYFPLFFSSARKISETVFLISLHWLLDLLIPSIILGWRLEALKALRFVSFIKIDSQVKEKGTYWCSCERKSFSLYWMSMKTMGVSILSQKRLLFTALNLSGAFPFKLTLDQGCSGVLLCKDTSQYLVENKL